MSVKLQLGYAVFPSIICCPCNQCQCRHPLDPQTMASTDSFASPCAERHLPCTASILRKAAPRTLSASYLSAHNVRGALDRTEIDVAVQ